jgi:hypothetical protein
MNNNTHDSFDLEDLWDPSQKVVTAWSRTQEQNSKTRRTYSRRGSTGAQAFSGRTKRFADPSQPHNRKTFGIEEETEVLPQEEGPLNGIGYWGDSSIPSFSDGLAEENPMPKAPPGHRFTRAHSVTEISRMAEDNHLPKIPPGRRFTRAHSVSGISTDTRPPKPSSLHLRSLSSTTSSAVASRRSSSVSSFQSSSTSSNFDSISSDISVGLSENVHPNWNPLAALEANASPKRAAAIDGERKGVKKVRSSRHPNRSKDAPLTSMGGSNSFSNLARHGEGGLSWAKDPFNVPKQPSLASFSDFGYLTDATESSPANTSVGSSRKRGVCGSPSYDFDDASTPPAGGGFSDMMDSRSRKGSRILSPPTTRLGSFSLNSDKKEEQKNSRTMDIASDDGGKTDPESQDGDGDSGDDASVESVGCLRSAIPSFASHPSKQRRRSSLGGLDNPMFGSVSKMAPEENLEDTGSDILGSMPSEKDLKFLIKTMRKEKNGRSHQSWHVAPPLAWESERRAKFFQWTTRSLGFTMRAGGVAVAFLQIPKTKGADVLELLESAYTSHKAIAQGQENIASNQECTPTNGKMQMMMDMMSSTKKSVVNSGLKMFTFQPDSNGYEAL